MSNEALVEITPNIKVMESLRSVGYSNDAAIADIVDNSYDAGANRVYIFLETKDKEPKITIADNGIGMDFETLKEAVKLGSDTEHDSVDLGKFGVGLVTASISMGRCFHVITKKEGGELLSATEDIDEMMKNKWRVPISKASEEDALIFSEHLKSEKSGTIVIITKCDSITNSNITHWANRLKNHLGRVFRLILAPDTPDAVKFFVNKEEVPSLDPLEWKNENTIKEIEKINIEVETLGGKIIKGDIEIRMARIYDENKDSTFGRSKKYQGLYFMRNNREIVHDALCFDCLSDHSDENNRLRIEIRVGSELDELFRLSFNKQKVEPLQSVDNKISNIITPWVKTNKKRAEKEKAVDAAPEVGAIGRKVADNIRRKPKGSLILPTSKALTRKTGKKDPNNKGVEPTGDGGEHAKEGKKGRPRLSDLCEFSQKAMGSGGGMFETTKEGRLIKIAWNVDHPFYQNFVSNTKEKEAEKFIEGLHYLVYALAAAELTYEQQCDDKIGIIENVHTYMSMNMRTLLS